MPVVRFALSRPQCDDDAWARATRGELALYDHLLDGQSTLEDARLHYASAAAAAGAKTGHLGAMLRQIELLLRAGAPERPCRELLLDGLPEAQPDRPLPAPAPRAGRHPDLRSR